VEDSSGRRRTLFNQYAAARSRDVAQPSWQVLRLWLYGAAMIAVTFAFAWRYPLGANSHTLTDIGKLARYQGAEFAGYVAGMLALFGCYLLALREIRGQHFRRRAGRLFDGRGLRSGRGRRRCCR